MIIGNTAPTAILETALAKARHHGFLLSGPQGIGKASIAKNLAVSVLAKASPFPERTVAQQCSAGAYPNFFYISRLEDDTGKLKSDITVEQIRTLLNSLKQKPGVGGPRFIIIDSMEDLSTPAANCLLKMLEEPPQQTFFLNICHNLSRVLPTIRSRCLTINFKALSDAEMTLAIGQTIDQEALELACGSPGNYHEILKAGGQSTISAIKRLLMQTNMNDLKTNIQDLLKKLSDQLAGSVLQQFLYQQALKDPATFAHSAQAVERFLRYSDGTHLDGAHRLEAAVLLAQNPDYEELV